MMLPDHVAHAPPRLAILEGYVEELLLGQPILLHLQAWQLDGYLEQAGAYAPPTQAQIGALRGSRHRQLEQTTSDLQERQTVAADDERFAAGGDALATRGQRRPQLGRGPLREL